mgnify:FL=1
MRNAARFALSEGWRNAWSGRGASISMILVIAATFAAISISDALVVGQLVADEAGWVAAGGRVLVAANEDGIEAADCERLNRVTGVIGAVALSRMPYRIGLSAAPEANLGLVGASAGLSRFLTAPVGQDAVVVSPELAASYGLADGGWTALLPRSAAGDPSHSEPAPLPHEGVHPLRVIAAPMLGDEYQGAVLVPMPTSANTFTCYVATEPGALDAVRAAIPAMLPGRGARPTTVADRLLGGAFAHDYPAEYLSRTTRWAPIAGGVLAGLVWVLLRWVRRAQDSLYATLGFRAWHRAATQGVEWVALLAAGVLVAGDAATITLVAGHHWDRSTAVHVLRAVSMAAATATVVAMLATLLPLRSPLAALKDRQ